MLSQNCTQGTKQPADEYCGTTVDTGDGLKTYTDAHCNVAYDPDDNCKNKSPDGSCAMELNKQNSGYYDPDDKCSATDVDGNCSNKPSEYNYRDKDDTCSATFGGNYDPDQSCGKEVKDGNNFGPDGDECCQIGKRVSASADGDQSCSQLLVGAGNTKSKDELCGTWYDTNNTKHTDTDQLCKDTGDPNPPAANDQSA